MLPAASRPSRPSGAGRRVRAGRPAGARPTIRAAVRPRALSGADGRNGRHGRHDARHDGAGLRRLARPAGGGQASDGQWLSFATTLPQGAPSVSWQFIISMALMGVIVLAVSVWAVRRVTAPLGMLSAAADRLGRDVAAEPLAEAGTAEMQQAARAFNRMQERLRRLIESRTQMLAALSHDLRTPLTLLRLRDRGSRRRRRARQDAGDDRRDGRDDRTTLAFARDEVRAEPRRRVDIAALLASVGGRHGRRRPAGDHGARGAAEPRMPAGSLEARDHQPARQCGEIRQARRRRDHRGSEDASRSPSTTTGRAFPRRNCRACSSRSTGSRIRAAATPAGPGLGLAIAQSIVQAHGGELTLANRPGGGLRACIRLPV